MDQALANRPYEVAGAKKHHPPRRAEISTGFGFSPNASSTSSSFRTWSGDQVCNLLPRADWLLSQPRTLRCQPTTLGQRLTNGLCGPL